ncbi:hypothetical protein D9M68_520220 [compost metagenome]
MLLALDAFGHGQQIQRFRHVDDVVRHLVGRGVRANGVDEGFVNLQRIQRQALQVRQAGVARAEIVDSHRMPLLPGLRDDAARLVHVHEPTFGGFEPDLPGVDGRAFEHALQHAQRLAVFQVARAQVDGDVRAAVPGEQILHVPDHQAEHLFGDAGHQPALLGDRDEQVGPQGLAAGPDPAHQGFRADAPAGLEIDDGLVMDGEFPPPDGGGEFARDRQAPAR